jgi:hypothetical protein
VSQQKITRDDIESQLRAIQTDVTGRVTSEKQKIVTGAAVGIVLLFLVVYLLGRKGGKKKTTLVEIRRV